MPTLSAPSVIAPATIANASHQARPYSGRHASPAISSIDAIQDAADDRVVLGTRAVGDVAGTELAQLRDDGIEVARRLPEEDQRAQQHRLLLIEVGPGEERLHGGGGRAEAGGEKDPE